MEVGVWDGNTGLTVSLTQFLLSKTLTYFPIFLLSKWYIEFLPDIIQHSTPLSSKESSEIIRMTQSYVD